MSVLSSPFERYLRELHARFADFCDGEVATYIPELAAANPDWFGICLVTVDGRQYQVGDTDRQFTIQSISKPLAYGYALETHGQREVASRIGVEPSGEAFNSISLEPQTGRPLNPMINAGAIATTSLVPGNDLDTRTENLKAMFQRYVGRPVDIDEAVYRSESMTGHRNRAIGYMLRSFDILTEDPRDPLELYFRQCSVKVDCRDLAMIGATLAAAGVNPRTKERALSPEHVHRVLSVMMSSGMYDYAGSWTYEVGLPAKSGVAGGVLAVLPGQFGIAVYSPRLDVKGNSVRGIQVCRSISNDWALHCLKVPSTAHATIRARYDAQAIASKRRRSVARQHFFEEHGAEIAIYELQGELSFAGAEKVVQSVLGELRDRHRVILDFRRVLTIDRGSSVLFEQLAQQCDPREHSIKFCSVKHLHGFIRELLAAYGAWEGPVVFPDRDLALEWCENDLEQAHGYDAPAGERCELGEVDLLQGLDSDEIARVREYLVPIHFSRGDVVVREGDTADELFLLVEGVVSVTIGLSAGGLRRLTTMQAGMAFGEQALMGEGVRGADVRAETDGECYLLSASAFEQLERRDLPLYTRVLQNLLMNVSNMLSRTTREIAALAQ